MRYMKIAITSSILLFGLLMGTSLSFAKPEYSKKEKQPCTTCHVAQGKKDLNTVGTCYKDNNHSLATCKVPAKS
jgi:hypothetical protein